MSILAVSPSDRRIAIASAPIHQPAPPILDLVARVGNAIKKINDAHAGRDIVAVTHGGVIKAAIALALGLGPEGGLKFAIENCSLTRLDYLTLNGDFGWRVGMVNHQPWLAGGDHPAMHQPAGPEIKLA